MSEWDGTPEPAGLPVQQPVPPERSGFDEYAMLALRLHDLHRSGEQTVEGVLHSRDKVRAKIAELESWLTGQYERLADLARDIGEAPPGPAAPGQPPPHQPAPHQPPPAAQSAAPYPFPPPGHTPPPGQYPQMGYLPPPPPPGLPPPPPPGTGPPPPPAVELPGQAARPELPPGPARFALPATADLPPADPGVPAGAGPWSVPQPRSPYAGPGPVAGVTAHWGEPISAPPVSGGPTSAGPTSAGPVPAGPTSVGLTSGGPVPGGPGSAGPPPVAGLPDPYRELELAQQAFHAAEAGVAQAKDLAPRPALFPTWSPLARAVAVYAGCAGVMAVLQWVLLAASGVVNLDGFGYVAWSCAGLPAMAFFGGYLLLHLVGRPKVGEVPDTHPRLGFLICFLATPAALCFSVISRLV